jgi:hypothetical protein
MRTIAAPPVNPTTPMCKWRNTATTEWIGSVQWGNGGTESVM